MKKTVAFLLALVLLCSLAGCGSRQSTGAADANDAAQPKPPMASGGAGRSESAAPSADSAQEPTPALDADGAEALTDIEDPEMLLGVWNDGVCSIEALGLEYVLPQGWDYATEEDMRATLNAVVEDGMLNERGKEQVEANMNRIVYGMLASDPVTGNNVQVMYESMKEVDPDRKLDVETYVQATISQMKNAIGGADDTSLDFGDTYSARLGGKEFLVLPVQLSMSGTSAHEWMYIRRVGDWMATVVFTATGDVDVEAMEGGVSAFAPLGGGSSAASGAAPSMPPTASGDIGLVYSTMFFDYAVVSAESPAEYDGYTAASGNKLLVVGVMVKNDFGSTLPMYDTDFQIQWGDGDEDYAWVVDAFNDDMMPLEWELADGEKVTYDMLFEVPAAQNDFSLVYLEEYTEDGESKTGDFYSADFTLATPAAA